MSLSLINMPDYPNQIASLERQLDGMTRRVTELEKELAEERAANHSNRRSVEALRTTLLPLYHGLQVVFGHVEAMGVSGEAGAPQNGSQSDATRQVWDSWKQKLGGLTAQAIDILLLHGPMNQTQLRLQLRCASRSVTNIVGALNKAGLINKADGKITLKPLFK
jgi:hypothetical protein